MKTVKRVVKDLTEKYRETDPYKISSLLNIHVLPWDPHREINGFYKYDKRNKYIFINNNLREELQRFVCAHELGHAVLHPRANTPFLRNSTFFSVDKIEVEANCFAVHLLLSNEDLQDYETKKHVLLENGIPIEMARFI
jgi:Zn-dependent peptidase ImmA (M78 family)